MDLFILAVMICTSAAIVTNYVCTYKESNWMIRSSFIIWIIFALLLFTGISLIIIWYTLKSYMQIQNLEIVAYLVLGIAPIISVVLIVFFLYVYKRDIIKRTHVNNGNLDKQNLDTWRFCAYSIVFPLSCVANHLNYIIIAFIHDLPHATSVAIVYGVVLLFFYGLLKQVSYLCGGCATTLRLVCLLIGKLILMLFLSGYIAFSILLYFFLPIDDELDNAANHFISIYQTVFLFLTAMATYFLVSKPFRSPISIFTKAEFEFNIMGLNNRDENYKTSEIDKDQWSDLTDKERDLVIAKKVLTILKKQEEFLQRQTDVGNTNPEASDSHTIYLTGSTEDCSSTHSDIQPGMPLSRPQQGQSLPHVHTDSTTQRPTDVGKINPEASPLQITNAEEPN